MVMTKQEIIDKAISDLIDAGYGMENSLIVDIDTVYNIRDALASESGRTAIYLSYYNGVFISDEEDYMDLVNDPSYNKQFIVARVGKPKVDDWNNRVAFNRGKVWGPRVEKLLRILAWATNEIDGL